MTRGMRGKGGSVKGGEGGRSKRWGSECLGREYG